MATIERHVTRDLIVLDSMTPCREAARLMADRKVGSVGVREGGKIIGLVTERDLVSVPPGVYRGLVNEGQEEALMLVMLGTNVPEKPTYPPDHPLSKIKRP